MNLLIINEFYHPFYKAGGPVRSLVNLTKYLVNNNYNIYVMTSSNDLFLNTSNNIVIEKDVWISNDINKGIIFYSSFLINFCINFNRKIKSIDILHLNGIFGIKYILLPIFLTNKKIILSSRGMLNPEALNQKRIKKIFYLFILKFIVKFKKIYYHSTDINETLHLRNIFGPNIKIFTIDNIPTFHEFKYTKKRINNLNLFTLALISPMKNIDKILLSLKFCTSEITYEIYGPIKDYKYWERCKKIIATLPQNIKVFLKGSIQPNEIDLIYCNNHVNIMPSKSENFGHSLVESLSAGKPIITSFNVPWNDLDINNSGFNINPDDIDTLTNAIEYYAKLDNKEFNKIQYNAFNYINSKININNIVSEYTTMYQSI